MTEKFNPAPKDKHAEDPKQAEKVGQRPRGYIPSIRSGKQRAAGAVQAGCR